MLIDGGNEWFANTSRRAQAMEVKGMLYMGMGVSGGEEGARQGPALMPGGSKEGFESVKHVLMKIAAQVESGPCVAYIGKEGAGHYVKMVHNGIEYGDMQIIAEAYSVLVKLGGQSNEQLHELFKSWNDDGSELKSYLIEITADIFAQKDDKGTNKHLVDLIEDVAGAKGTGKWTVQEAAERSVPCPSIEAAVSMRNMSGLKPDRQMAATLYADLQQTKPSSPVVQLADTVKLALYCAKICCYAQGFMLLQTTSKQKEWNLSLGEISRIWKGGCIIRAVFLDRIREAFDRNPDLSSLLLDEYFAKAIKKCVDSLRQVVVFAAQAGIPVPAMSGSLNYIDAYRSAALPLNLVQAQRDYFGAHTYKRVDMEGTFHTQWQSG
eukprot:GHVS01065448.1.p1 GENE.GHVS01065448.1~~GHVS01065448.1.p1  ORF type:complete len:379 (+),score=50.07 GHVS01065448.1:433-1569(+)